MSRANNSNNGTANAIPINPNNTGSPNQRRTTTATTTTTNSKASNHRSTNTNSKTKPNTKSRKTKSQLFLLLQRTRIQTHKLLASTLTQCLNIGFTIADKAMYALGPILITLASVIIVGLTYVYFNVVLGMLTGTNWVVDWEDWDDYWKKRGWEWMVYGNENRGHGGNGASDSVHATDGNGGRNSDVSPTSQVPSNPPALLNPLQSIFLSLSTPTGIFHTLLVLFFLINILYNYYKCVTTSNIGPAYDRVVRELAEVTHFKYPETEEEKKECKKELDRKIMEKVERRRLEFRAARAAREAQLARNNGGNRSNGAAVNGRGTAMARNGSHGAASAGGASSANGDVESQTSSSSPLMASSNPTASPSSSTNHLTSPQSNTSFSNGSANIPSNPNNLPPLPKIHNWQLLSPQEWSFCRHSHQPKPPRSHYDHVTKQLVLNMDHYCPWMFNVIGYFNYRYFFNFLVYVVVSLTYGTLICLPGFWNSGGKEYRHQVRMGRERWERMNSGMNGGTNMAVGGMLVNPAGYVRHTATHPFIPIPEERTPLAMAFMMCLAVGCAVACLLFFHLHLILSAQTTIEFHGNLGKRRRKEIKDGKEEMWKNPYSVGRRGNWQLVYGKGCFGGVFVNVAEREGAGIFAIAFAFQWGGACFGEEETETNNG